MTTRRSASGGASTASRDWSASPPVCAAGPDVPQPVKRTRPWGSRRPPTRSGTPRSHSGCARIALRVSSPDTRAAKVPCRHGRLPVQPAPRGRVSRYRHRRPCQQRRLLDLSRDGPDPLSARGPRAPLRVRAVADPGPHRARLPLAGPVPREARARSPCHAPRHEELRHGTRDLGRGRTDRARGEVCAGCLRLRDARAHGGPSGLARALRRLRREELCGSMSATRTFQKTTLPNGLRVVTADMPQAKSVACFVMLAAGSRYETKDTNGIAHFAEHMFFKGTKNRPTARDIAGEIDSIGGEFNAFTGK